MHNRSNQIKENNHICDGNHIVETLRSNLQELSDAYVGKVAFDLVVDFLQKEFVVAAHRRLLNHGYRVTQSQIGFLTGVSPEVIRKTLCDKSKGEGTIDALTIEQRIVRLWLTEKEFLNEESGKPAVLLISGSGPTFQSLVARVVRGVTPQTATSALEQKGLVRVVRQHWIELILANPTT